MNIYAVIAEFNPFHNGHAHLVRKIKERDPEAAVVAVMSGSLVERGDVAMIDKYARAEAAVMCGADLVLELPAPWCFSGAEFFALGGVAVADRLGVVDILAFGSESGNIAELLDCESKLSSPEFAQVYDNERESRRRENTATLRAEVYAAMYGAGDIFNGSNNLLALEYLHAIRTLGSSLGVATVKRLGGDYNSDELGGIASASAIRSAAARGIKSFSGFVPQESEAILHRELDAGRRYDLSFLDTAVIALLRTCDPEALSGYMEVSGGIENRLCDAALVSRTIDELVDNVKSRRYSASRVRRALISIILGVKMTDVEVPPQFTMVLAANARGREVLAMARRRASISVLSKLSDSRNLDGIAAEQYARHMKAERLCELCCEGEPRRVGAIML